MSAADKRRVQWAYEPNTPQCCNCVGYRKATVEHDRQGAAKLQRATCSKGKFEIAPNGCCDKWSSRDGQRLRSS